MFDLDWLLGTFGKQAFFGEVWQKSPKVLANERGDHFRQLFGLSSMERALEFGQPRPPAVRLASSASNEKTQVPMSPNGRLDMEKLRKFYFQGQTVILNSVEDYDPAVAELARSVETEMGARVQVNAYLTPPLAQGFRAHYDTHDVLVAQIHGNKLWKVYGRDSVCPLNEMIDGDPRRRDAAQPPDEIDLRTGDLLYIPRGWIHEAKTTESASLHLTIGIHAPLARDLLASALDSLVKHHPELREALPVGPLMAADRNALDARFRSLMKLFAEHASLTDAASAIDDNLRRRGRSAGDGHLFEDMNLLRNVTAQDVIERRKNIPCRTIISSEGVALQFLNGAITGPAHFEAAMRYVETQANPFSISELPDLEPVHQLALGSSLVTDGLCRFSYN